MVNEIGVLLFAKRKASTVRLTVTTDAIALVQLPRTDSSRRAFLGSEGDGEGDGEAEADDEGDGLWGW